MLISFLSFQIIFFPDVNAFTQTNLTKYCLKRNWENYKRCFLIKIDGKRTLADQKKFQKNTKQSWVDFVVY